MATNNILEMKISSSSSSLSSEKRDSESGASLKQRGLKRKRKDKYDSPLPVKKRRIEYDGYATIDSITNMFANLCISK